MEVCGSREAVPVGVGQKEVRKQTEESGGLLQGDILVLVNWRF